MDKYYIMQKKIIGYHIQITKNLLHTLKKCKTSNIVQFFIDDIKNDDNIMMAVSYAKKNNITLVIHASYMINMARDFDRHSLTISLLMREFKLAEKLGNIYGIVLHVGKSLDMPISRAYNNMYMTIIYILKNTKETLVILETPAGQGTELCSDIDEFIRFYNKLKKYDRVKICIDSCHVFACGYDPVKYLNKIVKEIGIKHIALIHLNDSKNPIGSRKDRHEKIGYGYIKNLKQFFKIVLNLNIPIVIETLIDAL